MAADIHPPQLAVERLRLEAVVRWGVRVREPTRLDGTAQVEIAEANEVLAVPAGIASGFIVILV